MSDLNPGTSLAQKPHTLSHLETKLPFSVHCDQLISDLHDTPKSTLPQPPQTTDSEDQDHHLLHRSVSVAVSRRSGPWMASMARLAARAAASPPNHLDRWRENAVAEQAVSGSRGHGLCGKATSELVGLQTTVLEKMLSRSCSRRCRRLVSGEKKKTSLTK